MYAEAIIKMLSSTVEFAALIMLSFSIFRIPVKSNWSKILFSSSILALISLIQRYVVHEEDYAILGSIVCYVVLVMFIHNLPMLYALFVGITGYLAFTIIQILLVFLIEVFRIYDADSLMNSFLLGTLMQLISALIIFAVVAWMQYRKIGFMFIINRFHIKTLTKGYNAFLSAIIILSMITLELTLFSYRKNFSLIYSFAGLIVISLIGLIVTYNKNKHDIKQRYERLNKQ